MRPEGIKLLPWLVGVVDLLMIALATVLAIRFRVSLSIFDTAGDVLENSALASVFFVGTWLVLLVFFGTYELHVFGAGTEEFKLVVNASFFTAALVATMAFLMQYPLSRGFFVLLFPIGVLLLVLGRLLTRRHHPAPPHRRPLQREGAPGRHARLHRRDPHRARPREVARLPGDGLPRPERLRRTRGDLDGHPGAGAQRGGARRRRRAQPRHRLLHRRRGELVDGPAPAGVGPRGPRPRADHRGAQRDRRVQRAGEHPPGRRAAAHAPRPVAVAAGHQRRQARLRPRRRALHPRRAVAPAPRA